MSNFKYQDVKEKNLQTRVIKWLQSKGVYVINIWGNSFQRSGIPDLICCVNGKFVAIELKREGSRATPLQEYNIEQIIKSGGIAKLIRPSSFDELKKIIGGLLNE